MLESFLFYSYFLFLTFLTSKFMHWISHKRRFHEVNYRGKQLWLGSGAIIPCILILMFPFQDVMDGKDKWHHLLFITSALSLIGYYDDRYGIKHIKGIKGHLIHLIRQRKFSSGLLKIFGTFVVGCMISVLIFRSVAEIIIGIIVFSIWTNIINLLDVRPGRAIKGVWFLFFLLLLINGYWMQTIDFMILFLTAILFIIDVKEMGMLGDVGSNVLGGISGYWLLTQCSMSELVVFLIIGLILTIYAEKRSISDWIEKHPIIRKIDHWGRFS